MASVLNEESVEKKLLTVTNTQDSIQSLSLWIIHHRSNHAKIVELWMRALKKTAKPSHRLTLFYLCNDVVQNCKKKKAFVYNTTFKECLREAACLVRDQSVKNKVERIFNIWGERGVYDTAFIKSLHSILNGQHIKSYKVHESVKEPVAAPVVEVAAAHVDVEPKEEVVVQQAEQDAEESARILANFKPHEMIDQITAFMRQETEIKSRVSQLTHLKLDISSLEAVKHLKDRSHGNDFSNHFEDSVVKLEELIKRQAGHLENQRTLMRTLTLSETFYEEQYREAKIVANAYKNFGARINNMKKKLDDLKASMPEPDSPIPSPDINAPSPGSTPPHLGRSDFTYNPDGPMDYEQQLQHKSWVYNDARSMSGASVMDSVNQGSNSFPGSPFEEAPSPEESPPDQSLYGSDNASESLESRLASFFDRRPSSTADPPVYTPQIPHSVVSSSRSKVVDDEGSTTPLDDDDETPTTPVQDENFGSPPKRNPPPKRENPIDFLSRLISQTQKAPVKTETQQFLDSLTNMVNKKPNVDGQQQQKMVTTPQAWTAWKSKPNETNLSPSQPPSPSSSSYGPTNSAPTSPKQFPPDFTMAPPPIPMPVPPPVPLSMPPPPPPFVLGQAVPAGFSSPPLSYQQTSPGQKDKWPDLKHSELKNHTNSIQATHSSVLKELVPADEIVTTPESHNDNNSMEVTSSDEDSDTSRSKSETAVESKADVSQNLKQRTTSPGALKSHVFMPNPERPNLMTLTVTDDLDEEDMIDDDTVMEETPAWADKSDKPVHRSRSQSREKDTSLDSRLSESESTGDSGVGSAPHKMEPHADRNGRNNSRGEKCEDYWRNLDRKYDQYDQRGYGGQGDYRSFRNNRGAKDPVQAYAQAYREAFFQQYNRSRFPNFMQGPPPMDPRRPGYGKF